MIEEKTERLSEGYDFIEEAVSMTSEPLSFQDVNEIVITESESTGSPYRIRGKLKGVFAPVGGFSRNNRFYPEDHWSRVLENLDVQTRLKGRQMFGMLGHEDARVSDKQIREGLISHIVTKMEIREDANGKPFLYGEMDILDTPAGRILEAMHAGGAGLYVSSRGAGKLLDTPGKTYKTVSPEFFLETWDIVAKPGFLEAKPVFEQVKESTNESVNEEAIDSEGNTHEIIKTIEKDSEHPHRLEHKINGKTVSISKNDFPVDVKREEEHIKKAYNITTNEASNKEEKEGPGKFFTKDQLKENEEISTLKSQVEQLALVIEKVVDSLYEKKEPNINEDKAALGKFVELMADTNISEEAFEQVIEIIKKGI